MTYEQKEGVSEREYFRTMPTGGRSAPVAVDPCRCRRDFG